MNRLPSKTDLSRIDAMGDEDIVYDEDTGAPPDETFLSNAPRFEANGLREFQDKIKKAMSDL